MSTRDLMEGTFPVHIIIYSTIQYNSPLSTNTYYQIYNSGTDKHVLARMFVIACQLTQGVAETFMQ